MKKALLFVSVVFIFSSCVSAPKCEEQESKEYKVGKFTELHIEGGYKIHLIQGNDNKVVVKASDSEVFDYLQVKSWGNELRIDVEPDKFELDRIVLYITFKELESVHIEGGVKLQSEGYLDLDNFDLYVAGGAKIEMAMKAKEVKITGEGGVLFKLEGVAQELNATLVGAGHLDADKFKVDDASCKIEGVGTASVYPTKTLQAKIEGVGKVSYKGNPKVTKNIEGLGSVKRD